MTVRELRKKLQGLPLNMKVVIGSNKSIEAICTNRVDILLAEMDGSSNQEYILILPACKCKIKGCTANGINSNPELN